MNSAIEGLLLTDARAEMIQRVHSNQGKNQLTMEISFWVQIYYFVGFAERATLEEI